MVKTKNTTMEFQQGLFCYSYFLFLSSLLTHFLVLGHHHRGVVVVVLQAAVSSAL